MTDEEFHTAIYDITKKYKNEPEKCFEKMMKLKYPGTEHSVKLEHARFFYQKYMQFVKDDIKLDKDFTKNAYNQNSKIFKDNRISSFLFVILFLLLQPFCLQIS
jgi:hypothetical protein